MHKTGLERTQNHITNFLIGMHVFHSEIIERHICTLVFSESLKNFNSFLRVLSRIDYTFALNLDIPPCLGEGNFWRFYRGCVKSRLTEAYLGCLLSALRRLLRALSSFVF